MENLGRNRKKIDRIDGKIIEFLAKRMAVSSKIGQFKKKRGLKIQDPSREKKMIEHRVLLAKNKGLSANFTRQIFNCIFMQSRKEQDN